MSFQVICGSSHTVVISQDRAVVWSFGGGDNGKLGHGDTSRVYRFEVDFWYEMKVSI